jgi:hypothetical protein
MDCLQCFERGRSASVANRARVLRLWRQGAGGKIARNAVIANPGGHMAMVGIIPQLRAIEIKNAGRHS